MDTFFGFKPEKFRTIRVIFYYEIFISYALPVYHMEAGVFDNLQAIPGSEALL